MTGFNLKKWYLDLTTEKGDILYLYFVLLKIVGTVRTQVFAHFSSSEGREIRSAFGSWHSARGNQNLIICGPNSLDNRYQTSVVQLKLLHIQANLTYTPLCGMCTPADDNEIYRSKSRFISWNVPQPIASVEGIIRLDSGEIDINGMGYQDVVKLNMFRPPISRLLWGRAHFDDRCIVYNHLTFKDGTSSQNILMRKIGIRPSKIEDLIRESPDSRLHSLDGTNFAILENDEMGTTRIEHRDFILSLTPRRIFEEGSILGGGRMRSRIARKMLAILSGSTHERKMLSDATLDMGGKVIRGVAINETVCWK